MLALRTKKGLNLTEFESLYGLTATKGSLLVKITVYIKYTCCVNLVVMLI